MINNFKTIIFDCDGVILNSNRVKQAAYYNVIFSHYGDKFANLMIEYLSKNTGKPREHFFTYFLNNIVPSGTVGPNAEELVLEVSEEINKGLMECEISKSLFKLRENFPDTNWFIVSGGVQSELRNIFINRSLIDLFDGGIFGGPESKDEILKSLFQKNSIEFPAIYLGDSRFDYEVASQFNLDFLFISDWTDFKDWKSYCDSNNISSVRSLTALL